MTGTGSGIAKSYIGRPCLICGAPAVYEKVRHCRKCHSAYNKVNMRKHGERMEERIAYRRQACAAMFDCSLSTWDRWVKQGKMPRPIRINGVPRWLLSDLDEQLKLLRRKERT